MHTILFLPNDHMLCWAGRVPPGTSPRALALRIEREAPRQVQRLAQWEGDSLAHSQLEKTDLPGSLEDPQARDFPAGAKRPSGDRDPFGADLAENVDDGGNAGQGVCRAHRRDVPRGRMDGAGMLGEGDGSAMDVSGTLGAGDGPEIDVRGILGEDDGPEIDVQGILGQGDAPDVDSAGALEEEDGTGLDVRGLLGRGLVPDEEVLVGNAVIAMDALLYVLVGASLAAERISGGERVGPEPWRSGLAQRFIVPPNLALRVDILDDVLLVRADPPMLPCMGGSAAKIPTLSAGEREVLAALSREKSIRAAQKRLRCSRRRIFYVLEQARRKVGKLMREFRTGQVG